MENPFNKKPKCKVLGCKNRASDGDFGEPPSLRYGYCQIHKLEGLIREVKE